MALKRRLASWIWVAIVVIAAQCLPTAAQAHAGDGHASPGLSATSSGYTDDRAEAPVVKGHSALAAFASAASNIDPALAPSDCGPSACCGTGGLCGGVLLFDSTASLCEDSHARPVAAPSCSAPPGVTPDALGKPPKHLV